MQMVTQIPETRVVDRASSGPGESSIDRQDRWSRRWPRKRSAIPDRTVRSDCRCRSPFGELKRETGEQVLDVRRLSLRGQIGRTLERMESLADGERLRHINHLVPWPLFAMLETRGYRYRLVENNPENVQVLIWRLDPSSELEVGVGRSS